MSKNRTRRALLAASFTISAAVAGSADAQIATRAAAAPDRTLFTTYAFTLDSTEAYLSVCGSTQESSGCYGSATLGPFGHIGALIEGIPSVDTSTDVVTRFIYVVDEADAGSGVKLYIYKKTDAVTPSTDVVTVKLARSMALPLGGGAGTETFMAANQKYLYVGTNRSPFAVQIRKRDLAVVQVGGFSPPISVSGITSDAYGYVTVTFGASALGGGNYVFDSDGNLVQDGGGAEMMLGTAQALATSSLPAGGSSSGEPLQVHFKPGIEGH